MGSPVDVVVMAAGKGTRMKSSRPKVLHRIGGRALAQHVIDTAAGLSARSVVVITGHQAEAVEAGLIQPEALSRLQFVRQEPQLGTGHAVQQAMPVLPDDGVTLVLSGDVPLTEPGTLQALIERCGGRDMALLTLELPDPAGYGRVVRAPDGSVQAIVEHKDASPAQRDIREVYSGVMAVPTARLRQWLSQLGNDNAQGEYYLTDVVRMAVAAGETVQAYLITDEVQVAGVNSPVQLAALERAYQLRLAEGLMNQGVRLADPSRLDVRGQLQCGQDVEIDVNCVFEGKVQLGNGVRIGANCVVANVSIGDHTAIAPFTHIDGGNEGASVGQGAAIGPFSRLRPGAHLGNEVHVGNFVEIKNSTLADGAKANHLAYLGDATVGERVNYGAGAITANYDGANKHRTIIEADVHVGSNSVLVAPLTLGKGGTVGAGSVVTRGGEAGALTVTRARQVSIANWQRPQKKPKS
ncbi:bifunctional UDP-N-acetylglucosamine diphosphorylase/glucosamine-1-phosphate N-acetyltransferase GlmU [Hydrogenophaga sp. 5NK40-0174]|uniref:bifunctional UDP-N-acetylglucosamine diphosphorylase/glucosamine-1-phosphate N-acetyltransferase GlmU n=1 Tax=Hydrogenophaga sp. 5NK40-0174 TaxID=3127649 RepID=UPI00310B877B